MRLAVAAQQPAAGGQPILNRGSGLAQDLRFLARMTMPVGQGWHDLVTGMPVGGATNAAIHYSAGLGIGSMTGATGYQGDDPVLGPCYGIQGAGSLKGLSWPMNAGSGSSDNGGSALWLSGNQGTFVLRCAVGYYSTANRPLLCHPHNTGSTWAEPYSTWAMERASGSLAGVLRVATSSSASATVSSSSAFWDTASSDFVPWRFRTYAMIRDGDSVRFVRLAHHELGSGTVTELDETASGAGTQDWTYQSSPETGIYLANTKYWNDCGTGQFSMAGVWNRPLTLGELEQIHASPQLLWSPSVPTVRLGRKAAAGSVALTIQSMSVATSSANVALVQHQVLTIQSMAVATSVASPNLVQHQVLAVQSATVTVTADAPSLTQHQVLAVQAASVAVTATSPSLVQHQVLAIDSMSVAVSAQSPGLVQHQVLTVQPMSVAVTSAAPTLGVGLVVADLNVATTATTPGLTQHQVLAIQSMAVAVSADNVSLSGAVALAIQSMAVATTATTPGLVQHQILTVQPMAVSVSAQNVSLSGSVQLAIQSMAVAVAADSPGLVQHQTLAVQSLAVATSSANVALTQHQVLAIASLTAATATQQVTLAASIQLLVQSMTVATSAGAPVLVQHQVLAVQSVAVAVSMSGIVFDRDPAASWQVGPPHDRWKIGRPEEIWTT